MVSIICPIYNEEKFIVACVNSVLAQDYPPENLEVLFVDGRSTDRTCELLQPYLVQYPNIHLLDNPHKTVPYALNIAIRASHGDIIVRIDAHAEYPTNYVSVLVSNLLTLPNAENVGAACSTQPRKEGIVPEAITIATSHKFGVGNATYRVAHKAVVQQVDTVPFGCFRRSLFDKIGLFDEELTRNQDDEFNARIIKNGGAIYLIPNFSITYYSRDTLAKTAKMFYQYGLFKPLVNKKLGIPATVRQFFPPVFVLGLAVGIVLCCCIPILWYVYSGVLCVYLLFALAFALQEAVQRKKIALLVAMPPVFFTIHCSYGWGYLRGIVKLIFKQPFEVQVNR